MYADQTSTSLRAVLYRYDIRIIYEINLTIPGLYEHASSKKLQAVCVSPTSNEDRCGEILIQCPGKPELFTTLRSVLGQRMDDGLAQPEPMILPDQANENVADKLDQYINSMSNAYEDEYSHTVSYTRRHILNLLEGTEVSVNSSLTSIILSLSCRIRSCLRPSCSGMSLTY